MRKLKRKKTNAEKAQKRARQLRYMTVFMNGRQKRVKRPETIEGMPVDEYLGENADALYWHQNGEWDRIAENKE